MTTKNPRINVTFEPSIAALLATKAEKEHKSISKLVRDLTIESLEKQEDFYLSKLGDELDVKGAKRYSHEDAWK